jgi:hypothetical protein
MGRRSVDPGTAAPSAKNVRATPGLPNQPEHCSKGRGPMVGAGVAYAKVSAHCMECTHEVWVSRDQLGWHVANAEVCKGSFSAPVEEVRTHYFDADHQPLRAASGGEDR